MNSFSHSFSSCDEATFNPPQVHTLCYASNGDKKRRAKLHRVSKLLVCHDMKGNYLQDSYFHGSMYGNAFQLWHWDDIDAFCYFSHDLLSVPPQSWITACHSHGTNVIGTFITEWDYGRQQCKDLFATAETATQLANTMAGLCNSYHFDGWLINIENELDSNEVSNVLLFLKLLTSLCRHMNEFSLVLWYDAVTIEGKLAWQDGLTDQNIAFATACQGIFVNYTWKENSPLDSVQYLLQQKSCGGGQADSISLCPSDVYFGIDVFGRNTFGGGQWECATAMHALMCAGQDKDTADHSHMDECDIHNTHPSAALFAPGWLLENYQHCCEVTRPCKAKALTSPATTTREGDNLQVYTCDILTVPSTPHHERLASFCAQFLTQQDDIMCKTLQFWMSLCSRKHSVLGDQIIFSNHLQLSFSMSAGLCIFISGCPFVHFNAHQQWCHHRQVVLHTSAGVSVDSDGMLCPFYDVSLQGAVLWNPACVMAGGQASASFSSSTLPTYKCADGAQFHTSICYQTCFTGNACLCLQYAEDLTNGRPSRRSPGYPSSELSTAEPPPYSIVSTDNLLNAYNLEKLCFSSSNEPSILVVRVIFGEHFPVVSGQARQLLCYLGFQDIVTDCGVCTRFDGDTDNKCIALCMTSGVTAIAPAGDAMPCPSATNADGTYHPCDKWEKLGRYIHVEQHEATGGTIHSSPILWQIVTFKINISDSELAHEACSDDMGGELRQSKLHKMLSSVRIVCKYPASDCSRESKLYIDSINVQIEPIKNSPVFATEDSGRSEKEASSLQLSPFRDFKISPYYLYQTPISEQEILRISIRCNDLMTTSNHLSMEVGYISVLLHTNSRLLSSTVEYLSGTDPSKVLDDSGAGAYWIVPSSAPDSVPLFDHMDGSRCPVEVEGNGIRGVGKAVVLLTQTPQVGAVLDVPTCHLLAPPRASTTSSTGVRYYGLVTIIFSHLRPSFDCKQVTGDYPGMMSSTQLLVAFSPMPVI